MLLVLYIVCTDILQRDEFIYVTNPVLSLKTFSNVVSEPSNSTKSTVHKKRTNLYLSLKHKHV